MAKFFDWLSNLRPRQLLALAGVSALVMGLFMYFALSMVAKNSIPEVIPQDPENPQVEENEPEKNELKMVSVVVATKNIEPKNILVGSLLDTKEFPENAIPPDAVTDIAEVANKAARVKIYQGDIITRQKVYHSLEQSGFVGSIPPDCRAVTIAVSDVTGVSGFAKPGDYVDILLIEKYDNSVTSRLILQDVLLLSINKNMGVQKMNNNEENGNNNDSSVNPATTAIDNPTLATFALRPDEVLELVAASRLGEIYLMLRPLVPQSNYITGAEYTMQSLKAQRANQETPAAPATPPAPPPVETQPKETPAPVQERIEIIYGNEDEAQQNHIEQNEE